MNIWKIIYLNCGERYEFVIDRRSYTHNLSSCEIKAWKKFEMKSLNALKINSMCLDLAWQKACLDPTPLFYLDSFVKYVTTVPSR